jgi:hypothetical protein
VIPQRGAKHLSITSRWVDQPQQHLDRGSFASPIWTQEAENLTSFHFQSQVRNGNLISKYLP